MNRTAVDLGAHWSKAVRLAAVVLAGGILAAGCRGGGGGGSGGTGIGGTDEHGNQAFQATVVTPDGANIRGQINYGGDVDWFRFRGIQGRSYVLQLTGFPPDPNVSIGLDLTGDGNDLLGAQILDFTGATATGQLENTTGTEGGTPYDIPIPDGDVPAVGGSRIFWVCPNTNDYFIVIGHRRRQTGIGAYDIRLATSELMTINPNEMQSQSGGRDVLIVDDQGEEQFRGFIASELFVSGFEYIESMSAIIFGGVAADTNRQIFLPDDEDPQPFFVHLHIGFPNIYEALEEPSVQPPDGDDHTFVLSQELTSVGRSSGVDAPRTSGDAVLPLPDGGSIRVPVTSEWTSVDSSTSQHQFQGQMTLHLGDAVVGGRDITDAEFGDVEVRRLFHSIPWYFDLHPMDSATVGAGPVVASLPMGDLYQFFETRLLASPGNVVRDDGSRIPESERGFGQFNILYEASLKTFQVAMQQYGVSFGAPFSPFIIDADYADFAGQRVRVHSGGPGETGPVLIDLGTLPEPRLPLFNGDAGDINSEPGFRNPIRQLTDAEAVTLRNAFYGDGFYVQVTDRFTGEPLVRAEGGDLEISSLPTADPCNFPPCSGAVGSRELPVPGTVTFASELVGEGSVELYANGELLGALAKTVTANNLPACGLEGDDRSLATELDPGTYYWHAHGKDGKMWDGHFTVTSGECNLVLITQNDVKLPE